MRSQPAISPTYAPQICPGPNAADVVCIRMQKYLRLEFIPVSPDLGLVLLRLWLGISMFWLHGSGKLMNAINGSFKFADPLGIGEVPSMLLVVFAEVVCSALLIVGLFTRLAAFFLIVTLLVAFCLVHSMKLHGPGNGELAFIYLAGYFTIFVAGAGKYSVDKK
jgi:putative oxidoreductase